MARQWIGQCSTCRKKFSYSEILAQQNATLGKPRRQVCAECEKLAARGRKVTAADGPRLEGRFEGQGPFGGLGGQAKAHELDERSDAIGRERFGVADEEIQTLYRELQREDTPVVIAVAPTGSGKSTFIPYRLLVPEKLPRDTFTAGRQIVITQPRRDAATGIARHVGGDMHGAIVGPGHEVGYRVRGDHQCDWNNRMVYVTDGTLINWIVRGELDRISIVVLDEAHERSENIDVILGLLTDAMPQYPHLKLMIVSATIDHDAFREYFESRLPSGTRCGMVICTGDNPKRKWIHWRRDDIGVLGYGHDELWDLGKKVEDHLADAMLALFFAIEDAHDPGSPTLPHGVTEGSLERGDLLGFLHGRAPIENACKRIEHAIRKERPDLAKVTDVYPLFADVDEATRKKATEAKTDEKRRRIVIASNAAETSLTIVGLVHVVDSGFIKQTKWDHTLEQAPLRPVAHSQAGCKQRWGRVGRVAEGFVWSLYAKTQFKTYFPEDTTPDIQRACLDGVTLRAKRGGADQLEGAHFPWLSPPDTAEFQRSYKRLARLGLLDDQGDLTEAGVAAAMTGTEDTLFSQIVARADRFGFGMEAAVIVPFLKEGLSNLMPDDRDLGADQRVARRAAHDRLARSAKDDLELCLRVFDGAKQARATASSSHSLPSDVSWDPPTLPGNPPRRIRQMWERLARARSEREVRRICDEIKDQYRRAGGWRGEALQQFKNATSSVWETRRGLDSKVLRGIFKARDEIVAELAAKKKTHEDRELDFSGLDRLRLLLASTLEDAVYRRADDAEPGAPPRYERLWHASEDDPLVELADSPTGRLHAPEHVLLLGDRRITRRRSDEARAIAAASFVVALDPGLSSEARGLDDLHLADLFRHHLPRPVVGVEEDRLRRSMSKLERQYPVGSLARCRLLRVGGGRAQAEVIGEAEWPEGPARPVTTDGRQKRPVSREYHADPDSLESLTGSDDPMGDEIAEERRLRNQERGRAVGRPRSRPAAGPRVLGTLSAPASSAPLHEGAEILAEVTGYARNALEPRVLLSYPTRRERFEAFMDRAGVGDTIDVTVVGPTGAHDLVSGVRVRTIQEGLEIPVPTQQLLMTSEHRLSSRLAPETHLRLQILRIVSSTMAVHLTAFPLVAERISRLRDDETTQHQATVATIEEAGDNLFVHAILGRESIDGVPITAKLREGRRDYLVNDELQLPFAIGDQIQVHIRPSVHEKLRLYSSLTDKDRSLLAGIGIDVRSDRLIPQTSISLSDLVRVQRGLSSEKLAETLEELAAMSHLLSAGRIRSELESAFRPGSLQRGTVREFGPWGVELTLPTGAKAKVPREEITWQEQRPRVDSFVRLHEPIEIRVLRVDVRQGVVHASIKQVIPDPFASEDAMEEALADRRMTGWVNGYYADKGAFVTVAPGIKGLAYNASMRPANSGGWVDDPREVAKIGEKVTVEVDSWRLRHRKLQFTVLETHGMDKYPTGSDTRATKGKSGQDQDSRPIQWRGEPWPWTDPEDATSRHEKPKAPRAPDVQKRTPLESRKSPLSWSLSWK